MSEDSTSNASARKLTRWERTVFIPEGSPRIPHRHALRQVCRRAALPDRPIVRGEIPRLVSLGEDGRADLPRRIRMHRDESDGLSAR